MAQALPPRDVRLLLVDDDPAEIQVMSRMLAPFPDQRFATSGAVALRLAREAVPDLILLDAEMPGMSGFQVFEQLRADPLTAQVPVIFATSYHATVVELSVLEKGAADFVTKPLVAAQLLARVQAQLRLQALRQQRHGAPGAAPGIDAAGAWAPSAALAHPGPGQARGQAGGQVGSAGARRLLIVDDSVAAIQMLSNTLAGEAECHFATSAAEALNLARELAPDLVLLDAHMPDADGFTLCTALKGDELLRDTPVVFVTRFADAGCEKRAFEAGAADFVAKPYTPAILKARVRNLLALAHRRGEDGGSARTGRTGGEAGGLH